MASRSGEKVSYRQVAKGLFPGKLRTRKLFAPLGFLRWSRSDRTEQNQRLQRREKRGPLAQGPASTPGPQLGLSGSDAGVCSTATPGVRLEKVLSFRTPGFHNYKRKLCSKTTPDQNACERTGRCHRPPSPHLLHYHSALLKVDDRILRFRKYYTLSITLSLLFKILQILGLLL